MLDRQTFPLEIARKVLKPETISMAESPWAPSTAYAPLLPHNWTLPPVRALPNQEHHFASGCTTCFGTEEGFSLQASRTRKYGSYIPVAHLPCPQRNRLEAGHENWLKGVGARRPAAETSRSN